MFLTDKYKTDIAKIFLYWQLFQENYFLCLIIITLIHKLIVSQV